MRAAARRVINGVLARLGLRLINSSWGPRGFAAALERCRDQGVEPRQVVDVGAARGEWTRECMTVLPEADYFLIDPLPTNATFLDALRRDRPNVEFWCGALGAADGELPIYAHGDQSSFLPSEYGDASRQVVVPVRPLDSFIATQIKRPAEMLKLDVQGYEIEVLKGAQQCLSSVQLLLVEVSFRTIYTGSPFADDVIGWASHNGFRIYDICSYLQRPSDHELIQADILFARGTSQLFRHEGYESIRQSTSVAALS